MDVILPILFRINAREHGSIVQQITLPLWQGEATVTPFSFGRTHGYVIAPGDNLPNVHLLTTSANPSSEWTHVLRHRHLDFDITTSQQLDLTLASWVKHPRQLRALAEQAQFEQNTAVVRRSWINAFQYKREDAANGIEGLRPPQIGAIYAVQAHWTVNSDLATVVLPTGVGKTETMLSLLVAERCERLMVVVPTDALRTQIADKFIQFGLLRTASFDVISQKAQYPVVGILNRRPTNIDQVDSLFRKCNVVVTTMPLASQCSPKVLRRMAELCSDLFIDEAHHVAAPTWKEFKDAFENSRIVQFTATPFRNDNKPIGGKRIFTFSLRNAQQHGYFKQINFKPVIEWDPARKDIAIAGAAVEQLRADAHLGHILMARAANIPRAEEIFNCYRSFAEFNPVQIHTGITSIAERAEIRRKLISGESRIVVCVDMLGEGFDLPELKIAALHDIRKTLAVTLQLVGRFTRTRPDLGDATVFANIADTDVKDELKRLYQHDSDWNALLPLFNERVMESEFSLGEFLSGFQDLPEEITLRNVKPAMSAVVYRTKCDDWTPDNFAEGIQGYASLDRVYFTINPQENTLVIVTARRISVDWAQIDEIHNWDWQLYVLHWDRAQSLLFIHNSSNAGFFKQLAKAVAGESEQIKGPDVFRCFSCLSRLKLQNIGLLEHLGRLIRYTMRAGSDVEPALSETQREKAIKANMFGQGFENGHRSSIGCSYKGRIWSARTTNLLELTKWCHSVGEKLLDESIDPEEALRGTLVQEFVSERPKKVPIAVEWPNIFYREPEQVFSFQLNGNTAYLHAADLILVDPSDDGPLKFAVSTNDVTAQFELTLSQQNGTPESFIKLVSSPEAIITRRSQSMPLQEFFNEEPPTFWFADGSSLTGIEYVPLRKQPEPYPRNRIEEWDWAGTNIRVESQGIARDPASIQHRVVAEMKKRAYAVIFDDDDHGEAADVVGVIEQDDHIAVEFWHCKYALANQPGSRIKELYELCGQAQKSIRWMDKPRDLFTHLMRREPRRYLGIEATRYELGTEADLLRIREKTDSQSIRLSVFVVQPGLSIQAASQEQLELLAVTENYLVQTILAPFGVIGSR